MAARALVPFQQLVKRSFHEICSLFYPIIQNQRWYNRDMKATKENTEFCTVKEAALRSGLSLKTWYQGGAGTGSVPRIRFGRSVRLLRADVERFISDHVAKAKHAVKQDPIK